MPALKISSPRARRWATSAAPRDPPFRPPAYERVNTRFCWPVAWVRNLTQKRIRIR